MPIAVGAGFKPAPTGTFASWADGPGFKRASGLKIAKDSMPDADRKDFFISSNKADKAWAEWIAWELEAQGFTTILQAWGFRPRGNFVLQMQQAAIQGAPSPSYPLII